MRYIIEFLAKVTLRLIIMAIKIGVENLMTGMYVAKLDRPWLDTSFLFQGFVINNMDIISELRSTCDFVYVDEEKSKIVIPKKFNDHTVTSNIANRTELRRSKKFIYDSVDQQTFKTELPIARALQTDTRAYINDALDDVRLGRSINTNDAKQLVANLAESVVRNPNALLWLSHLKQRDEYTAIHSVNVCILALTFGRNLGLPKNELNQLGLGALLHDIGKMVVPLEILNKPGALTAKEFLALKEHPSFGYDLLKTKNKLPEFLLEVVKYHHERENGSGYPNGLIGRQLNQFTKIVTIVDVYDAITSDRVYHDAINPSVALNKMYTWAPKDFDKNLFNEFIKCLGIYPVGSLVELNTGEVGIVTSSAQNHRLKPTVLLVLDKDKSTYKSNKLINLASSVWRHDPKPREVLRVIENHSYGIDVNKVLVSSMLDNVAN